MLNSKLRRAIDEYITQNIVIITDKHIDENNINNTSDITKELPLNFCADDKITLDQLINEVGESFHDKLFSFIDKRKMTDVEVYKRAGIDRKLFSKIRSNPMYHPRKQTVLALAIALKLNIEETVDLLTSAEYALSPGSKGDLIVKYFIEHEIFDIMAINFALDEYKQPVLR